jgi:hypothetical protein
MKKTSLTVLVAVAKDGDGLASLQHEGAGEGGCCEGGVCEGCGLDLPAPFLWCNEALARTEA